MYLYSAPQWSILLFMLLIVGCKPEPKDPTTNQGDKILQVVATTGMIGDALKNIGQDKIKVSALMGPGVDPHLYKATQGDLGKLRAADIIFYNGLFLEGKMEEILQKLARNKPVFPITERIKKGQLRKFGDDEGDGKIYDPHIWFDPQLWMQAVQSMGARLAEIDAENADFYRANTNRYLGEINQLIDWSRAQMAKVPKENKVLITSHDAFGYFGKAYDIEVKGLQGISTQSEYGLKDITNLIEFIIKKKIPAIFIESSVPTKSIEAVIDGCNKKGFPVVNGGMLYGDAMGKAGTTEGTYIGMFKHNVSTISKSLNPVQ